MMNQVDADIPSLPASRVLEHIGDELARLAMVSDTIQDDLSSFLASGGLDPISVAALQRLDYISQYLQGLRGICHALASAPKADTIPVKPFMMNAKLGEIRERLSVLVGGSSNSRTLCAAGELELL